MTDHSRDRVEAAAKAIKARLESSKGDRMPTTDDAIRSVIPEDVLRNMRDPRRPSSLLRGWTCPVCGAGSDERDLRPSR